MLSLIIEDSYFIYIDETGFNLEKDHQMTWYPKGKIPYDYTHLKSKNISMLAAIDNKKVLGFRFYKKGIK